MGYIRHDAVVAVFYGFDEAGPAALNALRAEMPEEYRKFLLGPVVGINGYSTFVLTPDGSKEGRKPSDDMDGWRQRFIDAAKQSRYPRFVHLQLGGDDLKTIIRCTADREAIVLPGAVEGADKDED